MEKAYGEVMGERYIELVLATNHLLKNCLANKVDEQKRFVDEFLPKNKEKIYPIIFPEDYQNNNP